MVRKRFIIDLLLDLNVADYVVFLLVWFGLHIEQVVKAYLCLNHDVFVLEVESVDQEDEST